MRKIVGLALLGLWTLLVVPFLQAPATKLAEKLGADRYYTEAWEAAVESLTTLSQNPWFLILFGIVTGAVCFLWADYFIRRKGRQSEMKQFSPAEWDKPLEKHFRANFQNETVLLDGYDFIECTFDNVTFKFEGTRPFRFTGKTRGNSRKLVTDNVVVGQTLTLMNFFRPDLEIDYEVYKTGTRPHGRPAPSKIDETNKRAELIRKSREFVVSATKQDGIATDFKQALETFVPFFELRPYLSEGYLKNLNAQRTLHSPGEGTRLPALASWFLDELDRLEKEWGLRR